MPDKRSKKFKITYFSVEEEAINTFSSELKNCSPYSPDEDTGISFSVLSLDNKKSQYAHFFCLNRYRTRNLPKVGKLASNKEEKLGILENEGLIEKAYFALNEKTGEIAFQNNSSHCCHRAAFPGIIKRILNNNSIEIMSVQSDRRLRDSDEIVALDIPFRIPPPTEEEESNILEQHNLREGLAGLGEYLQMSCTQKLKLQVTRGYDAKKRKNCLSWKKIKALWGDVKKGKVTIRQKDDDDIDVGFLLIDLAGTPKATEIEVELDGHYPVEEEIIEKLKACLSDE